MAKFVTNAHLVAKFVTNASGAIWWPNLQLKQMVLCGYKSKLRSRYLGSLCIWQCLKIILNFKVRDFATYVALEANGQGELLFTIFMIFTVKSFIIIFHVIFRPSSGKNGALALEAFHRKSNNSSIGQWCKMH